MSSLVKTPESIEFLEIFSRLEKSKITKAEVARRIHVSRGYITMLLKSERSPGPAIMAHLRAFDAEITQAKERGIEIESRLDKVQELHDRLDYLSQHDRPSFEAARRVIESLSPEANSVVKQKTAKLLKTASAALHKPPGDSGAK